MRIFNCRALGFVINDKNETLIIKRSLSHSSAEEITTWEICGGGIEHGENPAQSIEREYEEETGIKVKTTQIINARTDEREGQPLLNIAYICKHISGDVKLTPEHTDFKWIPISDLENYDIGSHLAKDKEIFLKIISQTEA